MPSGVEEIGRAETFRCRLRQEGLSARTTRGFRRIVYAHYRKHGRDFPWRRTRDPYHILVSEVMLQQTQTTRVRGKYEHFIGLFPGFAALARAPLEEILGAWQGLGYNRRALALKRASQTVVEKFQGRLPECLDALLALPGIGPATASAIMVFAFGQPVAFVETNIRRAFIHFFFDGADSVRDSEILPLVEATLDASHARQWYYALMDYGAALKGRMPNPNRRSAHYRAQAPFEGSDRQIRGAILRSLLGGRSASASEIAQQSALPLRRVKENLSPLQKDGLIRETAGRYRIA